MEYRYLGRSGLQVSALSFGAWVTFAQQIDEDLAYACMEAAYQSGVNFFDNAEAYASLQRNRMMESLVKWVRRNPRLAEGMRRGRREGMDPGFLRALESFLAKFGDQSWSKARFDQDPKALFTLLLNMASQKPPRRGSPKGNQKSREKEFFSRFDEGEKEFAANLLDLGRASYRLRDDDNIYMGKIQAQIVAAVEKGKTRLQRKGRNFFSQAEGQVVARALRATHGSFSKSNILSKNLADTTHETSLFLKQRAS